MESARSLMPRITVEHHCALGVSFPSSLVGANREEGRQFLAELEQLTTRTEVYEPKTFAVRGGCLVLVYGEVQTYFPLARIKWFSVAL